MSAELVERIGEIEMQLEGVGHLLDDACNEAGANGHAIAVLREAEYEMSVAIGKLRALVRSKQ